MRYLTILPLLSGLLIAAAPAAVAAQQVPAAAASSVAAPATPATNPYQASVPVADTSAKNRSHAFAAALGRVMSQISGHAPSAAARRKASTFVRQYRYQRAPAGSPQPYRLVVTFASSAIAHLQRAEAAALADTDAGDVGTSRVSLPAGDHDIWVSGVRSALGFADVLAALRAQPGVRHVGVRKAHGDGMLLDVRTSVPLGRVLAALTSRGSFAASDATHAGAVVSLRWQK